MAAKSGIRAIGGYMSQVHEIEHVFINGHSQLEVICGPMFSGKTEELIRRIRRMEYARMRAIVFKPKIDNRFSEDLVVSHSDHRMSSVPVEGVKEMGEFLLDLGKKFHVIGLDEVQFFGLELVDFCEDLVAAGVRVIAAGLSEDYLARPFGPMPDLLVHADSITKLWAVCMKCGAPASKTQRIKLEGEKALESQVVIGATDFYEARCRACYKKYVVEKREDFKENNIKINMTL